MHFTTSYSIILCTNLVISLISHDIKRLTQRVFEYHIRLYFNKQQIKKIHRFKKKIVLAILTIIIAIINYIIKHFLNTILQQDRYKKNFKNNIIFILIIAIFWKILIFTLNHILTFYVSINYYKLFAEYHLAYAIKNVNIKSEKVRRSCQILNFDNGLNYRPCRKITAISYNVGGASLLVENNATNHFYLTIKRVCKDTTYLLIKQIYDDIVNKIDANKYYKYVTEAWKDYVATLDASQKVMDSKRRASLEKLCHELNYNAVVIEKKRNVIEWIKNYHPNWNLQKINAYLDQFIQLYSSSIITRDVLINWKISYIKFEHLCKLIKEGKGRIINSAPQKMQLLIAPDVGDQKRSVNLKMLFDYNVLYASGKSPEVLQKYMNIKKYIVASDYSSFDGSQGPWLQYLQNIMISRLLFDPESYLNVAYYSNGNCGKWIAAYCGFGANCDTSLVQVIATMSSGVPTTSWGNSLINILINVHEIKILRKIYDTQIICDGDDILIFSNESAIFSLNAEDYANYGLIAEMMFTTKLWEVEFISRMIIPVYDKVAGCEVYMTFPKIGRMFAKFGISARNYQYEDQTLTYLFCKLDSVVNGLAYLPKAREFVSLSCDMIMSRIKNLYDKGYIKENRLSNIDYPQFKFKLFDRERYVYTERTNYFFNRRYGFGIEEINGMLEFMITNIGNSECYNLNYYFGDIIQKMLKVDCGVDLSLNVNNYNDDYANIDSSHEILQRIEKINTQYNKFMQASNYKQRSKDQFYKEYKYVKIKLEEIIANDGVAFENNIFCYYGNETKKGIDGNLHNNYVIEQYRSNFIF
jgi:hypothetical protein